MKQCEPTVIFGDHIFYAKVNNKVIKITLVDTVRDMENQKSTLASIDHVSLIILAYDLTRKKTFENIDSWIEELKKYNKNLDHIILVGTKSDLINLILVSTEEGEKKLEEHKEIKAFFECSSKTGSNVDKIFEKVALLLYESLKKKDQSNQCCESCSVY